MKKFYILFSFILGIGLNLGYSQCQISAGVNQNITCGDSIQLTPVIQWNSMSNSTFNNYTIKSISFANDSLGYMVGDNANGAFYAKTTNGGVTWTSETLSEPGVTVALNCVSMFNDTLGCMVGSLTFQGQTFEIIGVIRGDSIYNGDFDDNPLLKNLRDVFFVTPNIGYVVGNFGAIGKTVNGGISWVAQNSNILHSLNSVYFTSPSTGYVVGLLGNIIKTTDGGTNWTSLNSNTTVSLYDVFFVTDSVGYVVGNGGLILKTTNAGNTWTPQTSSTSNDLRSIHFKPNGTGYIAGLGVILNSTNGTTWSTEYTLDSTLLSIDFPSNNVGYGVGEHGKILKKVFFDTFSWQPGSSLSNPNTQNPIATPSQTTTYTLTATAPNGCVATSDVTIAVNPKQAPEICIVSVNENNKNVVVWEKPVSDVIDSFYIYKETNVTNIYQLIGVVSYADMSIFTDNSSNPTVQSSKYQITFKDVCGLETEKSGAHKTMHLTINQGVGNTWNLIWEPYLGFSVATYNIYRGISPNSLTFIGSTSGTSTQYSDLNAPSGELYYQIEVVSPNPCDPSRSISSSRSNIASTEDVGIGNYNLSDIKVYPNPATDLLTISSENGSNIQNVKIYDLQGKLIKNVQSDYSKIDLSQIKSGLYIIQITTESQEQYHIKLTITK